MLTTPLALLGLAAVPALLAVYLLRNRVKRRNVSSLMLWVERTRMTHGGARLQRNRLPLLFFLELLILLLLVWAATGPQMLSRQSTRPLTIVLDNSASMSASGTAQRLLKSLPELIRKERFAPVQVVLAGTEPRWLGSDAVEALLSGKPADEWNQTAAAFNVEKALLLARAGRPPETKLLVLSDTRPEHSPEGGNLRWIAAGKPVSNAGFINAARSGDRCMVEIQGSGTVQITLSLGTQSRTVPVDLEAGTPRRMTFRLTDPTGRFEAHLPDDVLAIDNHVILLPTPPRRVRVKQRVRNPALKGLVGRAVESTGMLEISEGPYELLIADSDEAITEPEAWILRITSVNNTFPFTGPFVVDRASDLMEGISFEGLAWAGSKSAVLPGMPIVMAGNTPLLTRMDDLTGRPRYFMQIDPELSTVQHAPAWPTLFWNLLQARAAVQPGFKEVNLRPGMDAEAPETPGIFEKEFDGQTFQAAYNFFAANESDLSFCSFGDDGDWQTAETLDRHYADLTPLAILAALALLAGHQLLLRRERIAETEGL